MGGTGEQGFVLILTLISEQSSDTCASPMESLVASPVLLMTSSQAARLSCRWGGACLRYILELARSQMVSIRLQKRGGEFTHPMVSTRGMATRGGNPQYLGRTTVREGASLGCRWRQ